MPCQLSWKFWSLSLKIGESMVCAETAQKQSASHAAWPQTVDCPLRAALLRNPTDLRGWTSCIMLSAKAPKKRSLNAFFPAKFCMATVPGAVCQSLPEDTSCVACKTRRKTITRHICVVIRRLQRRFNYPSLRFVLTLLMNLLHVVVT